MTSGQYEQSMKELRKIVLHWDINHKGTISVEDVICFGKLYYMRGWKDHKDQEKKDLNEDIEEISNEHLNTSEVNK